MFDVGFWELALLGVLALVILGPERLPVVARTLGRWVRRGRRFVSNFGEELTEDSSVADLREEVRRMRNEIEGHTRETLNAVDGMSNEDNNTDASEPDRDDPRSMYEFSPDDVDNASSAEEEHDNNEAAGADESVEADEIADDLQESTSLASESSIDESTTANESLEPVDIPSDDEDKEALYARARQRYARVDGTKGIEHNAP